MKMQKKSEQQHVSIDTTHRMYYNTEDLAIRMCWMLVTCSYSC